MLAQKAVHWMVIGIITSIKYHSIKHIIAAAMRVAISSEHMKSWRCP